MFVQKKIKKYICEETKKRNAIIINNKNIFLIIIIIKTLIFSYRCQLKNDRLLFCSSAKRKQRMGEKGTSIFFLYIIIRKIIFFYVKHYHMLCRVDMMNALRNGIFFLNNSKVKSHIFKKDL